MRVKPQLLSTRQTGRALTNDHLDLDGAAQASSGVCSAKVAQQPEGLFHGRHLALRRAGVWWRRGPLTRPSTGRRRPIGPAWTELVEAAAGSSPGLYRPGSADDRRPMAKSGTAPGLIRVVGARTWVVRAGATAPPPGFRRLISMKKRCCTDDREHPALPVPTSESGHVRMPSTVTATLSE